MKITIEAMTPEEFFEANVTLPTAAGADLAGYYKLKALFFNAFAAADAVGAT